MATGEVDRADVDERVASSPQTNSRSSAARSRRQRRSLRRRASEKPRHSVEKLPARVERRKTIAIGLKSPVAMRQMAAPATSPPKRSALAGGRWSCRRPSNTSLFARSKESTWDVGTLETLNMEAVSAMRRGNSRLGRGNSLALRGFLTNSAAGTYRQTKRVSFEGESTTERRRHTVGRKKVLKVRT